MGGGGGAAEEGEEEGEEEEEQRVVAGGLVEVRLSLSLSLSNERLINPALAGGASRGFVGPAVGAELTVGGPHL